MAPKLRYSTDNSNRLVITKDKRRYPIEGEFRIEKNSLAFEPSRKSVFAKELDLPQKISFEGKWRITDNKDLKLILIETDNQVEDDELEIRGGIISAEDDAIIFQMHCLKEPDTDAIRLFRLGGRWQADELNQLTFIVTRDVTEDLLRFSGSWQIGKSQEIVYAYEKEDLIRKTRTQEQITFRGYWHISSNNRLAYIVDFKNGSLFEFKVRMESPDLIGKRGEIRYRISIGVKESAKEKAFSLFGTWKVSRINRISFEMDYGDGKIKAIAFGASVSLNRDNEFVFELKDRKDKDLNISVQFNKRFFKDNAILFARLNRLEEELRVEAGLKVRW